MVSASSLVGRPLFLVLALVLVCLSLCVPRVVGDFGFANWSPPVSSSTLQSTSGTPTAVEFQGKIHIVYRAASTLFYVSSTTGYSFTSPQELPSFLTEFDPYLVVVTDSTTNTKVLTLLVGGGSNSAILYYATYNGATTGFPFTTPTAALVSGSNAITNIGGDIDAIFTNTTGSNQLAIVYLSNIFAYTDNGVFNQGRSLYATLNNGVFTWSGTGSGAGTIFGGNNGNGAQWRSASEAAVFNAGTFTYVIQQSTTSGVLYYWTGTSFSPANNQPNLINVALDADYSGFVASAFVAPPFITGGWSGVFYISPSNTSLAYNLVGSGLNVNAPQVSTSRPVGFNDGVNINIPRQPVAAYFSLTQALYIYYLDFSDRPARIESINTTLNF